MAFRELPQDIQLDAPEGFTILPPDVKLDTGAQRLLAQKGKPYTQQVTQEEEIDAVNQSLGYPTGKETFKLPDLSKIGDYIGKLGLMAHEGLEQEAKGAAATTVLGANLIAQPIAGLYGAGRGMALRDINEAEKGYQQVMDIPGSLITSKEQVDALNAISKPFEWITRGADWLGEKAEKVTGIPYTEPTVSTAVQGALYFLLPKGVKQARAWYKGLTAQEKGLVVLSLEDMINKGYTEGEILRRWNNPTWREQALSRRNVGEQYVRREGPIDPMEMGEPGIPPTGPTQPTGGMPAPTGRPLIQPVSEMGVVPTPKPTITPTDFLKPTYRLLPEDVKLDQTPSPTLPVQESLTQGIAPTIEEVPRVEIETDPARIQEIKNSIAEGEMILKSGKSVTGRKMSKAELGAVQRSVDNARAKIGEAPTIEPEAPKSRSNLYEGIPAKEKTVLKNNPEYPIYNAVIAHPEGKKIVNAIMRGEDLAYDPRLAKIAQDYNERIGIHDIEQGQRIETSSEIGTDQIQELLREEMQRFKENPYTKESLDMRRAWEEENRKKMESIYQDDPDFIKEETVDNLIVHVENNIMGLKEDLYEQGYTNEQINRIIAEIEKGSTVEDAAKSVESIKEEIGNELFNTSGMFTLSGDQPITGKQFVKPEMRGDRLFDVKKATTDELRDRMQGPSTQADVGGYADTGGYSPDNMAVMELPEIVELARALNEGKYPFVKQKLASRMAIGLFRRNRRIGGQADIDLKADIFQEKGLAERVLAHEIGHMIDWLPDKDMARGNILGRIKSAKKFTARILEEYPGAKITEIDRAKLRQEAKRILAEEKAAFEEQFKGEDIGITPNDILEIWNGMSGRTNNKALYDYIARLSTIEKKAIIKMAMQGQVPDAVKSLINNQIPFKDWGAREKEIFNKLVEDELKKYNQFEYETIMGELKRLTQIWKPFDEAASKKFTKYRYSSKELYADAFSVLLNNPELLKQTAPTFTKAFFNYLENKPEVKAIYTEIQDRQTDTLELLKHRDMLIDDMFDEGEGISRDKLGADKLTVRKILDSLKYEMWDVNFKLEQKVDTLKKAGREIAPEDNPVYWVEELPYVSSKAFNYLRELGNKVKTPSEKDGITTKDIGKYMYARRVMTERAEMANPKGHTADTAQKEMDFLRIKLGPERFAKLEGYVKTLWEESQYVIDILEKSEMLDPEMMAKIRDNVNYATFDNLKYFEARYGKEVTGKIYKQIGMLSDIRNPYPTTIMKYLSLIRAAERKVTAQKVVDFLKTEYPDEITPARMKWIEPAMQPVEPNDPTKGMITFTHRGKVQAYYVDKYIASIFNRDPYEAGVIIKTLRAVTQPLKEIFVSKNPFWMIWNIQRDIRAVATQIPEANLFQALKYAFKSIPDAYLDVFKNISSPDVQEMLNQKILQVNRTYGGLHRTADEELDRLFQSYTMGDKEWNNKIVKVLVNLWNSLDAPGKFSERLLKIAGYKLMKDLSSRDPKEIAHVVRTRSGSPDFKRAGHLVQLYNNIFLFSNAGKEGLRASTESFQDSKSAYTWKTIKYDIIPKLLMYGAALGLFGKWAKDAMDNIPEREKANYTVVPLWITDSGKTVRLVFPHSFTGQLVTGSLWYAMNINKKKNVAALMDYMAGGIPYSGLNPLLGIMPDLWRYTTGKNPYDSWRGKYVIPESRFEAGPTHPANIKSMAKHVANNLGASSILMRFQTDDLERNKDYLEKLIDVPVLGRALERFVRIGNQGKQERIAEVTGEIRKKRARENIDVVDGIIDHLNENPKKVSQKDALALYQKMIMEGKIKSKVFNDFWQQYRHYTMLKGNDVFVRAMSQAKSREEKAAIFIEYLNQQNSGGSQ